MPTEEAIARLPAGLTTEADRRALLVLSSLPSLTPRALLDRLAVVGSAAACLEEVLAGRLGSEADRGVAAAADPGALGAALDLCCGRLVVAGGEEYPPSLLELHDPPLGLYVRGTSLRRCAGGVAVVGARNCSPLGREVAQDMGRGLASAGVAVVSGGARGIDAAAHEGALAAGGPTAAVLGSGIDVPYPKTNGRLLARIVEAGAVVSEYPPGAPALPYRFPARNRIVAAMSEATVVVEGATGSGSLITADFAMELGRPVFGVPGPVTSPLSEAPHELIRDGAGLVRGADDVLADLGRLDPRAGAAGAAAGRRTTDEVESDADAARAADDAPGDIGGEALTGTEARVWTALASPMLPEQVARLHGLPLPAVTSALVMLEMRGLVRAVGGRFERRLHRGGGA